MLTRSPLLAAAAFASSVAAHGTIPGFVTDGVWNQGFLLDYYYEKEQTGSFPNIAAWYAEDLDSGFIAPDAYGTSDINCHKNSAPGALTATVKAGGTVTFEWTTWPHNLGPVLTYVAKCSGDCSAADKTTLKWVKIDAVGIDLTTQTWASQTLINQNSTWTTTVPSTLAPGNYVFRHEIIAVHGAENLDGAQNYPLCFNIAITGSGTDNPVGTLGVDLYSETDPGIYFNPYVTLTTYVMPGPALYTGGSGGGSTTKTTTTTKATSTTTTKTTSPTTLSTTTKATTTTTTTTSKTTTSTGSSTSCAALYGQCGGIGFSGATCCSSGTCKYSNDYYSQCL